MLKRFYKVFKNQKCNIIGMIHVDALPGTPKYSGNFEKIIEKACAEANIYKRNNMDAILIENMHDVPYIQNSNIGPEIVASMARISTEIRKILPKSIPVGIQILACGNMQALAIAKVCNLQFIRVEGFVFGHVADEGYTNACAGDILRYRKNIDASNILIFTDIKKKHCSHSVTADISIVDTAKAAEFFLTDGIILTGVSTGHAADLNELNSLSGQIKCPILIGSGITTANINDYFENSHAVIIGSHFKINGNWQNDIHEETIKKFMNKILNLRKQ